MHGRELIRDAENPISSTRNILPSFLANLICLLSIVKLEIYAGSFTKAYCVF